MIRASAPPARSMALVVVGILAAASLVLGILVMLGSGSRDSGAALVLFPLLVLISIPVLSKRAAIEGDRRLFWLLLSALLLKLAASFVRYYLAFEVYGGVADAGFYAESGETLADGFRRGDFETGFDSFGGTNFIRLLTGIVFTITGSTTLGGFLVYSWIGFWGLYFFYRAFRIAVPEGNPRSYALLLFLLPSLLFWPSSIGKEAWMMFSLGIGTLGVAMILTGRLWKGLLVGGLGVWLALIVRPHLAGLVGVALVAGYLFRRSRTEERGDLAVVGKAVVVSILVVLATLLLFHTDKFLREAGVDSSGGLSGVLEDTADRTSLGGSEFAPSLFQSPARAPLAILTVLFRPLLIEAHNLQSLVAGVEGTFLLVFAAARWRWILSAFRSMRRQPFVAFAAVYTGLFIVAFSAFANFGLLARERVQVLPLFLVLLCIPPPPSAVEARRQRRAVEAPDERGDT